jgi:hypothetical protein
MSTCPWFPFCEGNIISPQNEIGNASRFETNCVQVFYFQRFSQKRNQGLRTLWVISDRSTPTRLRVPSNPWISRSILDIVQIFPRYNIGNSNIEIEKCEHVFPMPERIPGSPYGSASVFRNCTDNPLGSLGLAQLISSPTFFINNSKAVQMAACNQSLNPAFCVQTIYLGIENQLLFGPGTFLSVVPPDCRSIGLEHQPLADHWKWNRRF